MIFNDEIKGDFNFNYHNNDNNIGNNYILTVIIIIIITLWFTSQK